MRQTDCAFRDYREYKRKDLPRRVSAGASAFSVGATEDLYDLLVGFRFVPLYKCCFGVVRSQRGHFRTQRYEFPLPNAPEPGAHKIIMGYYEASTTEASPGGQI